MWPFTRTRTKAPPVQTRRFDAAAGGRRGFSAGSFGRINSEVSGAAATVGSRAAYLAANNPHVSLGVANWTGALIGPGIRATSKHPDAATRAAIASDFDAWAEDCDADGRTDFAGLQALIASEMVIRGEAFVVMLHDGPFRVRVIGSEQCDRSLTRPTEDGGAIVQGVEFDAAGRRVAYWLLPARETDQFQSWAPPVRVPAEDVCHVFKPLAPGQVRGVSWLAPIVLPAGELDKLTDALLMGAAVAAMHAGFLIDQNGTQTDSNPYEGSRSGDVLESGIEPGTLKWLPHGVDVKFNSPQAAQQTAEFVKHQLRALACGLGLPSHLLDGDLSGANYSSLRAGLLPFRQRVEQIQYGIFVPQILRPVYRRWITSAVLTSEIDATAFESQTADYLRAEWIMPRPMQVDPAKDMQAMSDALDMGVMSRRQAVAEQGWNVEDLDAEIAADRQREAALGLEFRSKPKPKAAPETSKDLAP